MVVRNVTLGLRTMDRGLTNDPAMVLAPLTSLRPANHGPYLRSMLLNIYHRIDNVGVIAKLKELLKGHPSLIIEFNASVPNGCDKIPNDEDQVPLKKTTFKEQILKRYDSRIDIVDALSNVTEVREKFSNQMEKYEMFIDIMKHFKAQSLIFGFNAFVPNYLENIFNDEDQAPPKKSTYKEQALKR
ncbi:hypothetical protein MTR67_002682 [Solanum verrucosum]|uniref:Uncharacterized protein n=1 Tax=Solanum verrucosum TaxID=315347 RepID=A0AAF0PR20_SOLVR|nr:hypothetical protein MTR67_002682 [Solanum verrucosum]